MAADEAHDDHDEHDHGTLTYLGSEVSDETLAHLRDVHPALAEALELTRDVPSMDDAAKERAILAQRKVEGHAQWLPGFHAPGDRCAACGKAMEPIFSDRFEQGTLAYTSFASSVPVHAEPTCLAAFSKKHPRPSPRDVDRLRREFTKEGSRPSPSMTMFFRHDLLAHPPFGLEDWANSVSEANPSMDKAAMRDIERVLQWVHKRLFH